MFIFVFTEFNLTLTIKKKTNNEIHIKFYILQLKYVIEYITIVTCIYSKRKYYSIDIDKKKHKYI